MNLEKGIKNPMLVGMIELMKADDTPEHREMFVKEVLKATFVAPVEITPPPVADESGVRRIAAGSQISFPLIQSKEGQKYFMAFTDLDEMKLYQRDDNPNVFALKFEDYVSMLLKADDAGRMSEAVGVVINPMSSNIILVKDVIANMMLTKLAMEQGIDPVKARREYKQREAQANAEEE